MVYVSFTTKFRTTSISRSDDDDGGKKNNSNNGFFLKGIQWVAENIMAK